MKGHLLAGGKIFCFAGAPVRLQGQKDERGRIWNMLLPVDAKKYRDDFGVLEVTAAYLEKMLENFRAELAAYTKLNGGSAEGYGKPITITHVGRKDGDPTIQRAVGWVEDMKRESDGLYVLVNWNEEGTALVKGDKFRFFSAEIYRNWVDQNTNKEVGPYLDKVALLTDPLFFEMPRVAAERQSNPAERPHAGATKMELDELKRALGLSADASAADVKAAIEAGKAAKTSLDRARNEAITASSTLDTFKAEKVLLEQRAVNAEKKVGELTTKLEAEATAKKEADATAVVAELLKAGKIQANAQDEVKESVRVLGAEKVRKMFAGSPSVVATTETGVAGSPNPANPAVDRITFTAEVDKHIKAGKSTAQAYELVRAELPDLVKRVSSQIPSKRPQREE